MRITSKIPFRFLLCFEIFYLVSLNVSGTVYSLQDTVTTYNEYLNARGEVYFRFYCKDCDLERISRIVSIDRKNHDTIYAYANRYQFDRFLKENNNYSILVPPSLLLNESVVKTGSDLKDWDVYPTYDAYVTMMNDYATNYPDLCQLYEIGTTVNGRQLLCVKLSDNVDDKESEPEFLFTSTIHGDEVTGYILLLHMIDYLLTNYNVIPEVTELLDNMEIWINPNANPDGTYFSGNNSVSGAVRYNANSVDLNRNFPDPEDGDHPDGNLWQPETIAMMEFMEEHNFVFSANYHGGAEVMNYPWDTWSRPHPDENWFEYVSTCYADTVKKYGGSDYFSDVEPDGVTNGYDWYTIAGGRQDFTTYFCNGREITIEVSSIKMPAAITLPDYWNYNYIAMLDYMGQCLTGIHGIVTDSVTGVPLTARISILDHDADSSHVYSDHTNGDYHRLIGPGTYDILCSAPEYISKTERNVVLDQYTSSQVLNFELRSVNNPFGISKVIDTRNTECWFGVDKQLHFYLQHAQNITISLYTYHGMLLRRIEYNAPQGYSNLSPVTDNERGFYLCRIVFNSENSVSMMKIQF